MEYMQERLISVVGLFVMMGIAWLMSSNRKKVSLRVVGGGLFLQFVFALLIFYTPPGRIFFEFLGDTFNSLLACVNEGTEFLFKGHVQDQELNAHTKEGHENGLLALKILPTIIFFSAFMSILYHIGVVQFVIRGMAWAMQRTLRTSGAESLSAAANIFVGQTEAPLVIKPYVATMTNSELMAIMVGGFATVAGGVLALYVSIGIDAGHLLVASVISAPAALLIAKLLRPETEEPQTLGDVRVEVPKQSVNIIDAVAQGTITGVKLAINVGAMLIVFLALIAVVNGILGWVNEGWSLQVIFGYLFWPFAWLMGVETADCSRVGELLGIKMAANEAVAYFKMYEWEGTEGLTQLSERSKVIATYALCGFANFASIGIQIGGIGPLAPKRQGDLARLGLKAMLGGTLAAFMTACIAGILL
jgi:CNT family concentrative nucleoside transporter